MQLNNLLRGWDFRKSSRACGQHDILLSLALLSLALHGYALPVGKTLEWHGNKAVDIPIWAPGLGEFISCFRSSGLHNGQAGTCTCRKSLIGFFQNYSHRSCSSGRDDFDLVILLPVCSLCWGLMLVPPDCLYAGLIVIVNSRSDCLSSPYPFKGRDYRTFMLLFRAIKSSS